MSPGSRAGIAANDEIMTFNGELAAKTDLFTIRKLLSNPGSTVAVVYRRSAVEHCVKLLLPADVESPKDPSH